MDDEDLESPPPSPPNGRKEDVNHDQDLDYDSTMNDLDELFDKEEEPVTPTARSIPYTNNPLDVGGDTWKAATTPSRTTSHNLSTKKPPSSTPRTTSVVSLPVQDPVVELQAKIQRLICVCMGVVFFMNVFFNCVHLSKLYNCQHGF